MRLFTESYTLFLTLRAMPEKKKVKAITKAKTKTARITVPKPVFMMETIYPVLIRIPDNNAVNEVLIPDIDYNKESPFHTFMQIAHSLGWNQDPIDGPVKKGRIWKMIRKGSGPVQYLTEDKCYASQGITNLVTQVDIVEIVIP